MTVREALLSSASFSVSFEQAEVIAVTRDLYLEENFTKEIAVSKAFELSKADMIKMVILMPNVSEGGVSISITDRHYLMGVANSIYAKYGEPLIQEQQPTVEYLDL